MRVPIGVSRPRSPNLPAPSERTQTAGAVSRGQVRPNATEPHFGGTAAHRSGDDRSRLAHSDRMTGASRRNSSRCAPLNWRRRRAPRGVSLKRTARWSIGSVFRSTRPALTARSTSPTALWCRSNNASARSLIVGPSRSGWPRTVSNSWCCAGVMPTAFACCSLHRRNWRNPVRRSRSRR
jgi:hypothetical protein